MKPYYISVILIIRTRIVEIISKISIKTLKSATEFDAETIERSKILVNFYIQINNGAIQNLEKNYQNFLKTVSFDDLFLFHEDMSRFFLKNFILEKAEFHSKQFSRQATDREEKNCK
jgi:hypothetical protein